MSAIRTAVLAVAALALLPCMAAAQSPPGFDELLRQIRQGADESARISREREQRFLRNRNEQQQLLRQAQAELQAAEQRAAQARRRFDDNQKELSELKKQIAEGMGDLGQMYASVRGAASDFRSQAAQSMTGAQFPQRMAVLERVSDDGALPGVRDLERFWFVLTEELVAGGRVARFEAEVVDKFGHRRDTQVTRIGHFTAFTDEGYVAMLPGDASLQLLPRQPGRRHVRLIDGFAEQAGRAPMLVDPSRGALLLIEGEKPTLSERIDQGGLVGYTILSIGGVGAFLALFQFLFLGRVSSGVRRQLKAPRAPSADNPLGRIFLSLKEEHGDEEQDPELMELWLSEAVLRETPRLERFQSLLKLFVAVAPLLGLLGTVTGMIVTFQAITVFGTGDPKLMAGGISQALVTTVLGLCVAVPLLFMNSLIATRSRGIVQVLDEQSAAVLAARLEKRGP